MEQDINILIMGCCINTMRWCTYYSKFCELSKDVPASDSFQPQLFELDYPKDRPAQLIAVSVNAKYR